MKKTLRQKAFTLAETLIVIGIIGVIAALTVPSLSNTANDKDIVAKVRKNHSALEDAFGRMIATYEDFDSWGSTLDTNTFGKRLFRSMKLTKDCGVTASKGCFAANTNMFKENASSLSANLDADGNTYKVILADGASIAANIGTPTCTANAGTGTELPQDLKEICGAILVDIDGPSKGKNIHGLDLFQFYITRKGIYPVGTAADEVFKYQDACTKIGAPTTATRSSACTAWVIYNANLDYKRTEGTTGKCLTDSNKTLDFTTNTSCD